MKKYFLLAFLFCIVENSSANSFIHRSGKELLDSTEKPVKLKGVNLGGWLLWEGWIWGGKLKGQTTIYSSMEGVVGKKDADDFRDNIYRNFISELDIKRISECGMNVVRVPFNNRIFDTASCNAIGWQVLDSLLKWCAKYHVYAVLDMHAAYGGQSPYFIADPEKAILWKSEIDKQKTISLWRKIAERYKNNKWVAGYDLLNEPIPSKDQDLVDLYKRIISAIREVDKNHMMIIEGSNFAKKFEFFKSLPDENMCFSFHLYTWFGGKPADKIQPYIDLSNRLNVPLWCGEWGENNYDVITQTLNSFEQANANLSGWCFWTWKKAPNGYASLNAINVNEDWKKFIMWCCKPDEKTKPSAATAKNAMEEFSKAMRAENNTMDVQLQKILSLDAAKK